MWKEYIKEEVPINTLLLFEVEDKKGEKEYHTGNIAKNSQGQLLGIIGGHFAFDYHKVNQYRVLEDILP